MSKKGHVLLEVKTDSKGKPQVTKVGTGVKGIDLVQTGTKRHSMKIDIVAPGIKPGYRRVAAKPRKAVGQDQMFRLREYNAERRQNKALKSGGKKTGGKKTGAVKSAPRSKTVMLAVPQAQAYPPTYSYVL